MITEQEQLETMASDFYGDLFTAQVESAPEEILDHVPERVTEMMNESLLAPYTAQEVERALFMMGANKAPGPDGFTAGFYQTHWGTVGRSVTNAVLNFLNGGQLPDGVNQTTIVLIPKIKHPQDLKNFRPISLCNVIYKICSKVLANRLRVFLDEIISAEQSAFVPGRLITDNVLVAYECTHYLKRKKGKTGACAIKLDMAKAYDRVDWNYLRGIMLRLGFADAFVNSVMRCVTSVSFSVRVNGNLSEPFRPTRGIRQGDPISPYLFLLCSEGLSCLLKSVGPIYLSRGVRVGVHAPWISHLLFADDCIVFSEASQRGAERLRDILVTYSKGSGQLVNRDKSAVFFSSNCDANAKQEVRTVLQIETEALAEKYLGLPTALGRSSKEAFEYMPNKIRGLVGAWSGREASCAGREVLLKSVAQAVPTYPMSCFLIPKDTCRKMKTVISNYWWGSSSDNRHMHWQRWELLTRPKLQGGIGFRDLRMFNLAMLGKQGWRLIENPDSLCARVLKGRYFHDTDFLTASRKKHASHTWRAILEGREILKKGLIRRIGDGSTTDIWRDRWLPNHFAGRPLSEPVDPQVQAVAELLTPSGAWNEDLIKQVFIDVDVHAILRTPIRGVGADTWAWEPERHGMYTVRSAYRRLFDEQHQRRSDGSASSSSDKTWKRIWGLCVPPKIRVFWWRVVNEFLPAKQVLHRRHIERTPNCEVCGADEESIKHILMDCTVAKVFWAEVRRLNAVKLPKFHPVTWVHDLIDPALCNPRDAAVILCGMWSLWMARNKRRHGEAATPVHAAVKWVIDTAFDLWNLSHPPGTQRDARQERRRWRKPGPGLIKCNVDASFSEQNSTGATGAVLRDHEGRICGGSAKWYNHCLNALATEAMACRNGMQLAIDRGVTRLLMETDCQVLVQLWNKRAMQRSEVDPHLFQMDELSRGFESFDLCFIYRDCNRLAHECARLVSRENPVDEWLVTPPGLRDIAHDDCNPAHE
jgi:hypothetical protein